MAKHAKHARENENPAIDAAHIVEDAESRQADAGEGNDQATGHSPDFVAIPAVPEHKLRSRRMRIALIVVSAVLVALIAALAYFAFMLVNEANDVAYESGSRTSSTKESSAMASDAKQIDEVKSHGDVPNLASLVGLSVDEAIAQVGRGATVTSEKDIEEVTGEGDDETTEVVGSNVTVELADETTDATGNTPSLYFECDADGVIVQAGYSTSVGSLNYGDMSFADIVQTGHIVENLLTDAGIATEAGSVELPAADQYRTKADDGVTIAQESYTFAGEGQDSEGAARTWSCRLSYDYSTANVSGNLADTIKLVYLYIGA